MRSNRAAPFPQPLPDDLIPDILLRLAPDDPAGIVRATAVCKAWRRIITDPAFAGQYSALHTAAPVLGFLHRPSNLEHPRFVSTTSFRAAAAPADHRQCQPLDCRHGLAVLYDYNRPRGSGYVVWDPATGARHRLPAVPPEVLGNPTVVCAACEGCDGHCCGGRLVVAFAGIENRPEDDYSAAHACLCAPEALGEPLCLCMHISVRLDHGRYYLNDDGPAAAAALVGDSLYFLCGPGILRYRYGLCLLSVDLAELLWEEDIEFLLHQELGFTEDDVLSMTELPREIRKRLGIGYNPNVVVMAAEGGGGGLGLAYLCPKVRTMLYLLAREEETGGAAGAGERWVQRRVIDLQTLLPVGNDPKTKPCFRGVSQEANVIFVSTEDGVFTIDCGGSSSLQATRKVCEKGVVRRWIYPFVSFYTESLLRKLARRANCQH